MDLMDSTKGYSKLWLSKQNQKRDIGDMDVDQKLIREYTNVRT